MIDNIQYTLTNLIICDHMAFFYNVNVIQINNNRKHRYPIPLSVSVIIPLGTSPTPPSSPRSSPRHVRLVPQHSISEPPRNTKKVSFDDRVIIYQYETFIPCLQEYYFNYQECKKQQLTQKYVMEHGTLEGFDLAKAIKLAEQADQEEENKLSYSSWCHVII